MHFPGYRYCGPGTDVEKSDREGGPTNELDNICRQHDIDLGADSPVSRETADKNFKEKASQQGVLGNAFAVGVHLNAKIAQIPFIGKHLPGAKADKRPGHPYPKTPDKKYRASYELRSRYKSGKYPGLNPGAKVQNMGTGTGSNEMEHSGADQTSGGNNQGAAASGGTGGSGGGGQVPPMNPVPIQTGTQIFHFSRTFRHYIATGTPTYTTSWDQQWSVIPYECPLSSMKPRDWQTINVISKRWRVLSVGFNLMHLIPFTNTPKTVGGAVSADIAFNLMPYCETYIDKGYQLPMWKLNTTDYLPNLTMTRNSTNQTDGTLKQLKVTNSWIAAQSSDNDTLNKYRKEIPWDFDLMNSKEWGTLQPTQEFSFEWKASPEDLTWRSALTLDALETPTVNSEATALARWDGAQSATNRENDLMTWNVKHNMRKPLPSCLIRPCTFHDSGNGLLPLVFQCLIKYHCTIECDINDIGFVPIFNREEKDAWSQQNLWDIWKKSNPPVTGKIATSVQWSGANAIGARFGPWREDFQVV